MIEKIRSIAEGEKAALLRIRHHLHAHPELSYQEFATARFVCDELTRLGIDFKSEVAGTGVVAIIQGKQPEKQCIALRADMDALPITETNDVDYRSQNDGVMHACGHDVHTTCLLGAASILQKLKNEFEGTVKLIFQPGEEKNPGGAKLMIEAGVLDNPKPNSIIALHVYPNLPSGMAGFRSGQYMASADEIFITIKGKGGHAALPHLTIDTIAIAAQIITALQQVVSRKNNPLTPTVLSFGKIAGGHTTNVIPEKVSIEGTLRTFDEKWRYEAHQLIKDISIQIATAYGATAIIDIPEGYPSLFNEPELTMQTKKIAEEYLGSENVTDLDLRMTAEDFSFYTLHTKGCFFRLGTNLNNEEYLHPVHTSNFNIDEEALPIGAGLMACIAIELLK